MTTSSLLYLVDGMRLEGDAYVELSRLLGILRRQGWNGFEPANEFLAGLLD